MNPAALDPLRQAAERQPRSAEPWHRLAQALAAAGEPAEALEAYRHLAGLAPGLADAHFGLANQHYALGQYPEALDAYLRALELAPDSPEVRNNLALLLNLLGQQPLAEQCLLEALSLKPDYGDALNNLGNLYRDQGRYREADRQFDAALALTPDNARLLTNVGLLRKAEGRLDEAIMLYRQAGGRPDTPPELPFNLAIALIQSGDYPAGFERYEARWQLPRLAALRAPVDAAVRPWRDEPLAGRTLLLWHEQGLGDMIQMARLIPVLAAAHPACRLILRVDRPLVRLLAGLDGVAQVVGSDETLPAADFHLSAMSLPARLAIRSDRLLGRVPYLAADPALSERMERRLGRRDGRLRLGLVRQSGAAGFGRPARDREARSLMPADVEALLAAVAADWIDLQVGGDPLPPPLAGRLRAPGAIGDLADTAALVSRLDALVTVDTAAAHLGGALGVPTLVLMSVAGGNLFPASGDTMPWYPSMTLLRQRVPGDWAALWPELARRIGRFDAAV